MKTGKKKPAAKNSRRSAGKSAARKTRKPQQAGKHSEKRSGKRIGKTGGKSPRRKPPAQPVLAPVKPEPRQQPVEIPEKLRLCYNAIEDKKGVNIRVLDLAGLTSMADYFVVVSGTSDRHVKSIADSVEEKLRGTGYKNYGLEGYESGQWVLVDAGDIVVHIFHERTREYYDLDGLWADAPEIAAYLAADASARS